LYPDRAVTDPPGMGRADGWHVVGVAVDGGVGRIV
jgi:hypothetical protein